MCSRSPHRTDTGSVVRSSYREARPRRLLCVERSATCRALTGACVTMLDGPLVGWVAQRGARESGRGSRPGSGVTALHGPGAGHTPQATNEPKRFRSLRTIRGAPINSERAQGSRARGKGLYNEYNEYICTTAGL